MHLERTTQSPFTDLAIIVGWLCIIAGTLSCLLMLVDIKYGVFALGLLSIGFIWRAIGKHRQTYPTQWVQVDTTGLTLMPGDEHFTHDDMGQLEIVEEIFTTVRRDAHVTLARYNIRSDRLDRTFFLSEVREDCESWLKRFERLRTQPPAEISRQPPKSIQYIAFILPFLAVGAVGLSWLTQGWMVLIGAGLHVMAAICGLILLEKRKLATVLGILWALCLFARPFILPVQHDYGTFSLFAEAHIWFYISGGVALFSAFVFTRPVH